MFTPLQRVPVPAGCQRQLTGWPGYSEVAVTQLDKAESAQDLTREVAELLQRLGQTLNMCVLYGVQHNVSRTSLSGSFPVLHDFVARHGQTHFNVNEGKLLINGTAVPDTPLAANIVSRLARLNLLSFVVDPGFSEEEYERLMELLLAPTTGAPASQNASDLMQTLGFKHVQAKTFVYHRVAEGESVPAASAAGAPLPDLANVMAFLKEEPEANGERSAEDIRQLASDSEKLAELILRSVEIRATAANLGEGESLTELVVGCVSKVVSKLSTGPSARTAKGRKQARKSLMLLEKALLQRLHELSGDQAADAAAKLITDTADSLDMETLAAKHARNRRAAEESAGKLRRLIDQSGDDAAEMEKMRAKLLEQGLTPEGWQELVINRPAADGGESGAADGGSGDVRVLTMLMARLEEALLLPQAAEPGKSSPHVKELVAETNRQAERLARQSERRIEALKRALHGDSGRPALTRKALLETIAEIAQELSQPLTIMTMAISMLEGSVAGSLTEDTKPVLNMAAEGCKRMGHLLNCLIRIAGTPTDMHPDKTVLETLYNVSEDEMQLVSHKQRSNSGG